MPNYVVEVRIYPRESPKVATISFLSIHVMNAPSIKVATEQALASMIRTYGTMRWRHARYKLHARVAANTRTDNVLPTLGSDNKPYTHIIHPPL